MKAYFFFKMLLFLQLWVFSNSESFFTVPGDSPHKLFLDILKFQM